MLERIDTIDSKMEVQLSKFQTSGDSSDHDMLQRLLENYLRIKADLRKLTVKCFGDSTNSRQMKTLLEEKQRYR